MAKLNENYETIMIFTPKTADRKANQSSGRKFTGLIENTLHWT